MRVTNPSGSAQVDFRFLGVAYSIPPSGHLDFSDNLGPDIRLGPGRMQPGLNSVLAALGTAIAVNPGDQAASATAIAAAATAATEAYTAATPANWATSAPTTVKAAIDRMSTLLKALNSGTAIP
jgi:hypothetical protein